MHSNLVQVKRGDAVWQLEFLRGEGLFIFSCIDNLLQGSDECCVATCIMVKHNPRHHQSDICKRWILERVFGTPSLPSLVGAATRTKVLSWQTRVCHDKTSFVATKACLSQRRFCRMACEIAHFLCSLLMQWSLQNLILVPTSSYKVLIWL